VQCTLAKSFKFLLHRTVTPVGFRELVQVGLGRSDLHVDGLYGRYGLTAPSILGRRASQRHESASSALPQSLRVRANENPMNELTTGPIIATARSLLKRVAPSLDYFVSAR
jgi:hypothetical protein